MPVDDDSLQQSGIRGRKSCCLCVVIVLLLIVAIMNALVTAGLLYFLSIAHRGMETIEFINGEYIRVLSDVEFQDLALHSNLSVLNDKDLDISGKQVTVGQIDGTKMMLNENQTVLACDDFEIKTSDKKTLFATNIPVNLEQYSVNNVHAPIIELASVDSLDRYKSLHIFSYQDAIVMGMEGVQASAGGNIDISANNIDIRSLKESVTLWSEAGIFLDANLPLEGKGLFFSNIGEYKLCICMKIGKLFVVPDKSPDTSCYKANEDRNPCSDTNES